MLGLGLQRFVERTFGTKMKDGGQGAGSTSGLGGLTPAAKPQNHTAGINSFAGTLDRKMHEGGTMPSPGNTSPIKTPNSGPGISDLTKRTDSKMHDGDGQKRGFLGMKPLNEWKPETRRDIANIGAVLSERYGGTGNYARQRAGEFGTNGMKDALIAKG